MTVLLVLVTFAVFVTIDYVRKEKRAPQTQPLAVEAVPAVAPRLVPPIVSGFAIPENLRYHPGHTWALKESPSLVRVGLDDFAAHLAGKIESIRLPKRGQWIRQGQKFATIFKDGGSVEMVSPIEGEVTNVNDALARDNAAACHDPYGNGWLISVLSPDAATNFRNLLGGDVARRWMAEAASRLRATGAQYRRKGSFEMAAGGTVFLDEIGDINLKTRSDLLRVLQEREITRVGSSRPIPVDFRCVAATNKNLEALVEEGKFRADLYYRLNVFQIHLSSLRERRSDIPLLADHFMHKFSDAMNKRITRISPQAMDLLDRYPWPGNVRELENAAERAMVVAREPELQEEDFSLKVTASPDGHSPHCQDYNCAMAPSHAVEWIDLKKATLCAECRALTRGR